MSTTAVKQEGPAAVTSTPSVGSHVRGYWRRVRGGDIGALPAVLGLLVLCTVFAIMRPSFLSAGNFANLFTQGAAVTLIAMGLVFVLLLGEIDLSAGFASGVCAAVLANVVTVLGYPWYVAVAAAVLTGVVIGTILGLLVAKIGIPSFVVTLAGFLAFQGVVLLLMEEGRNISVRDSVLVAIATATCRRCSAGRSPPWPSPATPPCNCCATATAPRGVWSPTRWWWCSPGSADWRSSSVSPSTCSTWSAAATC